MHAVVKLKPLVFHLAVPLVGGGLSALLAGNIREIYSNLNLPSFAPPGIIFPVVWTILYLLIGFSAYLISTAPGVSQGDKKAALGWYGLSLATNFLWPVLFFRFLLLTFGAWWVVLMIAVTALCAVLFYRIRRWAGLLLIPYLLWLGYACVLSFAVASLN